MPVENHPDQRLPQLDDPALLAEVLPHLRTAIELLRNDGLIGHAGPLGKLATSIEAHLESTSPAEAPSADPSIVAGKEIKPTKHHYLPQQLKDADPLSRFGLR